MITTEPQPSRRRLQWVVNWATVALLAAVPVVWLMVRSDVCHETNDPFYMSRCPSSASATAVGTEHVVTEDLTLDGGHHGPIVIAADGVTLDCGGHEVSGSGAAGIDISGRDNVTVANCRVTGFDIGIALTRTTGSTITGNSAEANGTGFSLTHSEGNVLRDNVATLNAAGFSLRASNGNTLEANSTRRGSYGLLINESSGSQIRDNQIELAMSTGIRVHGTNTVVSGNTISTRGSAIALSGSDNRVTGNRMHGGNAAISLSPGAWRNTFSQNEASDIRHGVSGNRVTLYNDFADGVGVGIDTPLVVTADLELDANHEGRIVIAADGVTLDCGGHRVNRPSWADSSDVGIQIRGHTGVSVENCILDGFDLGIGLWRAPNSTLAGNGADIWVQRSPNATIIDNTTSRLVVSRSRHATVENNFADGIGILLYRGSDSVVAENTGGIALKGSNNNHVAANAVDGEWLLLDRSADNTIVGNTIHTRRGLVLHKAVANVVTGNEVSGSWIRVSSSENNVVMDNVAKNGSTGFHIRWANDNTFSGNRAINNETGFLIRESADNTFRNNQAHGAETALTIDDASAAVNTFSNNDGF